MIFLANFPLQLFWDPDLNRAGVTDRMKICYTKVQNSKVYESESWGIEEKNEATGTSRPVW